jgi:hypothetical protein
MKSPCCLCPPLMLLFSMRSVLYQMKVVLPRTSCKFFSLWCDLGGVVRSNTPKVLTSWVNVSNRDWLVWYMEPQNGSIGVMGWTLLS